MDDDRTLRVALVGCGWFAVRAHLPALQKLERAKALGFQVSLYALCSRSQASAERASKKLDKHRKADVKIFLDLDAVLADPLVDGSYFAGSFSSSCAAMVWRCCLT